MKWILPVVAMGWMLPPASCNVTGLEVYDAYITGPGTVNYADGVRSLSPSTTSLNLAVGKPYLGCVVAYRFPVAKSGGVELPPECQPTGFAADGVSWEGM
jgi:hypothetical protein